MAQFRSLTDSESATMQGSIDDGGDQTHASNFRTLDAPHNTVFDQDNNRTIALPQTLSETETPFIIKRDIDDVKTFFAMEDVGGFDAIGKAIKAYIPTQKIGFAGLGIEAGEQLKDGVTEAPPARYTPEGQRIIKGPLGGDVVVKPKAAKLMEKLRPLYDAMSNLPDDLIVKSNALVERNKKYMADAKIDGTDLDGMNKFLYDLTSGAGSMATSMGLAGLSRNPNVATLYFGAIQKSSVYQEARAAGKTPDEATDISNVAGLVEGGLEYIGLDYFMKALKGNSAVKRFASGFIIEAAQEGSQGAGEEVITQGSGIRDKELAQTAQDILYQAALGGFIGGPTNVIVGSFVKEKAVEAGFDEKTANDMAKYAEENISVSRENMGEFIDKELAPIARDDKSAQEFIKLMQNFGNDVDLVNPDSLDPQTRAIFDQYIEMFNESVTDVQGVAGVERAFYDRAIAAGVAEDESVASSKLIGARADAASRALGITPMQWLESKNISLNVEGSAQSQEQERIKVEAKAIKDSFASRAPRLDRNDPRSVARTLGLSAPPQSVLQFIRSQGGVSISSVNDQVNRAATKSGRASGEMRQMFDGSRRLGHYVSEQGKGLDDLYRALVDAGYIEEQDSAQDQSDPQAVLDLMQREANGERVYPVEVEYQLIDYEDANSSNAGYLGSLGIDENTSEEEIARILSERDQVMMQPVSEESDIVFQQAEKTDTPEFKAWFGNSKVVDKDGKPLVMYHGTAEDIEQFTSPNRAARGLIFFSKNPLFASGYAGSKGDQSGGPNVIPVYISAKKIHKKMRWSDAQGYGAQYFKDKGYDAVRIIDDGGAETLAVVDPTQVKSVNNRGTFDANDARILYQSDADFLRSRLVDAVDEMKQAKGSGDQMLAALKNTQGVKEEEISWTGLDEFLKGKATVTKQEIQDYLRDNAVQIEEVTLGGKTYKFGSTAEYMAEIKKLEKQKKFDEAEALTLEMEEFDLGGSEAEGQTKFAQYTLPGGQNYREVLLTLPDWSGRNSRYTRRLQEIAEGHGRGDRPGGYYSYATQEEIAELDALQEKTGEPSDDFTSGHFEQKNILAHVRLNDRTDADGKRVLFVEEIQSDWHQAGRKRGYNDGEKAKLPDGYKVIPRQEDEYTYYEIQDANGRNLLEVGTENQISPDEAERVAAEALSDTGKVPDAPFKKSWHEMAFRRVAQMAAQQGYDRIAWTTGEQQNERFDLSKHISELKARLSPDMAGMYEVSALGMNGERVIEKRSVSKDDLPDVVGKELAQKIIDDLPDTGDAKPSPKYRSYGGLDLKVGGSGMKGFYDNILVKYANKFGKKFGAKVGNTTINAQRGVVDQNATVQPREGESLSQAARRMQQQADWGVAETGTVRATEGAQTVHSMDITPDMHASAQRGFELFQGEGGSKGPRGSADFSKPGQVTINLFKEANASTLLHELGHVFLRDMRDVAKTTKRPLVRKDYETIKKFLGATGDTLTVRQEEKFARAFEQYLREGKAPKPELQGIFDRFKEWLTAIYKSAQDLNVQISPDVRKVFDRMLGADFAMAEKLNQEQAMIDKEADYAIAAAQANESTFKRDTAEIFNDLGDRIGDVFTPISTRLGNINEKLKHIVRRFVFDTNLFTHEDNLKIKPFVERANKEMTPEDYNVLDLALKNRDVDKVDFLMDKYGMAEDYQAVRDVLDNLFNEATAAGMEVGFIDDYFPRKVRRGMAGEYIAEMKMQKQWSDIKLAMGEADPDGTMSLEEQAEFVNSYLRGYQRSTLIMNKPSHTKERSVAYVTPYFNQKYYEDSMETLVGYIGGMRKGIEVRKLFGKSEEEVEDNIGKFVLDLVNKGEILPQQEAELRTLLMAVANPQGPGKFVSWMRDAAYIYTMGSPISAVTQIQDLGLSLYKNGFFPTGKSLIKSLSGRAVLTKEELGIDDIMQEFADQTRSAEAVRKIFRLTGLSFMDNVGKQTYIDASYARLIKANKKGGKEFVDNLEVIFGEDAGQVRQDLKDGTMSDNVKYLLFSELSDMQPISIAEMPVGYAKAGNWRVLYMLKTYTIKQFDIYRREGFDLIASGDPKKMAKGLGNLIKLGSCLLLMGMGTDEIKDFMLGRVTTPSDLFMNNLWRLFGVSKYQIYKAKEEGPIMAAALSVMPPQFSISADIYKDVSKVVSGKQELKNARTIGGIPLVGKPFYWWLGGGAEKSGRGTASGGGKTGISPP